MPDSYSRKNNIVLTDYNYKRDIENRILMADFNVRDVDVLQEILDGPLNTSIKQICSHLEDIKPKELIPILDKLSKTQLLKRSGETVTVDKEMRKYYESQIIKFNDNFEPDLGFIQGLLSKVPITELLNWYSINRTSDNIFSSIVESYLVNPKTYETYLRELKFDNSVLRAIMDEVFSSPDYKVHSSELLEKYSLSREQFEEAMLHLEFNFVCYLGYNHEGEQWGEVIMPFHEWGTYLRRLKETLPQPIVDEDSIERVHSDDFGFICDMKELLEMAQDEEIVLDVDSEYVQRIIITFSEINVALVRANLMQSLPSSCDWMAKPLQEQASILHQNAFNRLRKGSQKYTERDFGEVERSLRRVASLGWIYLEDFLQSLTLPIGNAEPIALKNKGKKWVYEFPSYSDGDLEFIQKVILGSLFECGIVALGVHQDRTCFCVTSFGRKALG